MAKNKVKKVKTRPEKKVEEKKIKPELPLAPFERLARKAGAERVSAGAVVELRDAIEDLALEIASDVVKVSRHAGRKTIKPEDIRVVVE